MKTKTAKIAKVTNGGVAKTSKLITKKKINKVSPLIKKDKKESAVPLVLPKVHKKKNAKRNARINAENGKLDEMTNIKGRKTEETNKKKEVDSNGKGMRVKAKKSNNATNGNKSKPKPSTEFNVEGNDSKKSVTAVSNKKRETKPKLKKIKAIPDDEQVETSESDTEQEDNVAEPENKEVKPEKIINKKEYSVFVGNLPPSIKTSVLTSLFKQYGTIVSVRLRTNEGQKVFYRKEAKLAKSLNAYVRFSEKEEMEKSCEMDGHMIEGNRIRVTCQAVKPWGAVKSTVFVGNIHKGTSDNELYEFFSQVGEIEYVRQISNRYIAYVCFKKGVSIKKALKLDQQMLRNRPLRIMKVDTSLSNMRKNKKGHLVKKNRLPRQGHNKETSGDKQGKENDFHGNVVNDGGKKKKKGSKKHAGKEKKMLSQKLQAAMKIKKEV